MSEERKMKRIPVFLDILVDESVSMEEACEIVNHAFDGLSNSAITIKSHTDRNVKEIRMMLKGGVLISQDFGKDGTRKAQRF